MQGRETGVAVHEGDGHVARRLLDSHRGVQMRNEPLAWEAEPKALRGNSQTSPLKNHLQS